MRTTRRALARSICAAAALFASILIASCDNAYAVYQNVNQEKAQKGTNVFKETTCTNAFKFNGKYYATTAKLYSSDIHSYSSSESYSWSKVAIGGGSSYTLRSAVLVGDATSGTVYALTGDDSSSVALYSSTNGSTWTSISLPSNPGSTGTFAFDALYSAGNHLYAEGNRNVTNKGTSTSTSYYYLYYYTGSGWGIVSNFSNLDSTPIRGVVADSDSSPSTFWFASTGQLYSNSSYDGSGTFTSLYSNLSSRTIWALSYVNSALYVSTKDGYLYQDISGTFSSEHVDSSSRPLTKVAYVPYSGGNLLLVGTDTDDVDTAAVGYYEGSFGSLVLGSTNHYVASTSAVYSTTVSAFPVHNFFWDSANNNLFVCISPGASSTSYYGLYESSWNSPSWTGWDAQ